MRVLISSSERRHAIAELALGDAERRGNLGQDVLFLADQIERGLAGQRGDPAGARGDRLLADDLEQPHLADIVQVRAAAKLLGEVAHPDDADDVRVFLAEEGHRAGLSGLGDGHVGPGHRSAGHDQAVDGLLDLVEPLLADGLGVGEVEPEPVGLDLAAGLLGVLAQVPVEGVVQQVGRRMGPADGLAAVGVHGGRGVGVQRDGPLGDPADVEDEVVVLAGVLDGEDEAGAADRADVADLAAGLGVEGGPIEDQGDRRAGAVRGGGRLGKLSLLEDADHRSRRPRWSRSRGTRTRGGRLP